MKKGAPNPYSESPAFNPDKEAIARVYENERLQKEVDGLFAWGRPYMAVVTLGSILALSLFGLKSALESAFTNKKQDKKPVAAVQALAEVPVQNSLEPVQAPNEVTREDYEMSLINRPIVYAGTGDTIKSQYVARLLGLMTLHPEISISKVDRVAKLIDSLPIRNRNDVLILDAELNRLELQAAGMLPEIKGR